MSEGQLDESTDELIQRTMQSLQNSLDTQTYDFDHTQNTKEEEPSIDHYMTRQSAYNQQVYGYYDDEGHVV